MMKWLVVLSFVAGAALSWGVYVPVVHRAAFELKSNLRAFMFVGAAYFLVAVLIPAFFIFVAKSDPTVKPGSVPNYHLHASLWGLAAGLAGAMGALCVIFATTKAGPGAAIFVAPWSSVARRSLTRWRRSTTFTPRRPLPTGASSPVWCWQSPERRWC